MATEHRKPFPSACSGKPLKQPKLQPFKSSRETLSSSTVYGYTRPIAWPQRVPEEGQLGGMSTTRENPTVGPALPPGRSQLIRISDETDDNDEIGEEDD